MRKVFLTPNDPPVQSDCDAATQHGAAEIISGPIPLAMEREGISTYGYHEIVPPTPPLDDAVDAWKIKYVLAGKPGHTTGVTLLDDVTAAVTGLGSQQALIKFQNFPQWLLSDPLIPMLKAGLLIDDATFESYWREAMAL